MSFTATDHRLMARALQLAQQGRYSTHPNPRVGCVIAYGDEVVGEGWHAFAGGSHAEIVALGQAGGRATGATVYLTLEPCSHHGRTGPCADALVAAGVSKVIVAVRDPNPRVNGAGLARLREAGIDVTEGLLADQAQAQNRGFFSRFRQGRPYIRCKLAATLDGRTAGADGESKWITGASARLDVQRWRASSDAILTGVSTVIADDPALTVRDLAALGAVMPERVHRPLRVVLDSNGRFPLSARMLSEHGRTLVFAAQPNATLARRLQEAGAQMEVSPDGNGKVDLNAVVTELARREINEVLVEAGPTLSGALLEAGLVDELILYLAPQLLGDAARGLFVLPAVRGLADRIRLSIKDVRTVGVDLRILAYPLSQRAAPE